MFILSIKSTFFQKVTSFFFHASNISKPFWGQFWNKSEQNSWASPGGRGTRTTLPSLLGKILEINRENLLYRKKSLKSTVKIRQKQREKISR
jgi:hypothetical protein